MARRASRERAAFWRELVGRRQQSSLSVERFCEQAGVSTASFYQWQRKLGASIRRTACDVTAERPARGRLVPIRIVPDPPTVCGNSAGVLEIEFPGEIRLRIPAGCDAATLQCVLRMLLDGGVREDGSC